MSVCSVVECRGRVVAWGWCDKHYRRMKHHGSLDHTRPSPSERFAKFVAKSSDGACHEWIGFIAQNGYGRFTVGGRSVPAHRFAYEAVNGAVPDELTIDHLCFNKRCVNPDHLEAVTMRENILRSSGPAAVNARRVLCSRGHEFDYTDASGRRICLTCKRAAKAARRLARAS